MLILLFSIVRNVISVTSVKCQVLRMFSKWHENFPKNLKCFKISENFTRNLSQFNITWCAEGWVYVLKANLYSLHPFSLILQSFLTPMPPRIQTINYTYYLRLLEIYKWVRRDSQLNVMPSDSAGRR